MKNGWGMVINLRVVYGNFEDGRLILKEYHVDGVADQKVDPITVYEGD
jgi:hypothetical protein